MPEIAIEVWCGHCGAGICGETEISGTAITTQCPDCRDAAHDEGVDEGYDKGYEEGKKEGYSEGYNEGFDAGRDNAFKEMEGGK